MFALSMMSSASPVPDLGKGKARKTFRSRAVAARRSQPRVCGAVSVSAASDGPKRVVIAGAPASGKGTQCELIVEKFGLVHISAGDLLRAAVKEGTPAGLRAKEFMDRGDLVPDEVVVTMVKDALDTPAAKEKGWLLDGYPRSASQFFPPPEDIVDRLTIRSDDTEEKARNRLNVHHSNVDAVMGKYKDIMKEIDGNRSKQDVYAEIEGIIDAM